MSEMTRGELYTATRGAGGSIAVKVTVIVATFGSDEWRERGRRAAASVPRSAADVIRFHQNDGTAASCRNIAANSATPGMLCFLDADDRLDPDFITIMLDKLRSWPVGLEGACAESSAQPDGIVNQNARMEDPSGENGTSGQEVGLTARAALFVPAIQYVSGGTHVGPAEIPAWLGNLYEVNCAVIGTLIHRDLFWQLGGFRETLSDGTSLNSLEDWEMWIRAVKAGAVMVPVPEARYLATQENRSDGSRRNSDQTPYAAIRAEHADFDWANIRSYKVGYPGMVQS